MKIDRIRCFISVAKTRNLSQTAKELYLSQPSVSRIISTLEEEVGVKLLNRKNRQLELTAEGEVFLKHCITMAAQWDSALEEIQTLQMRNQQLRIGVLGFAEDRLLHAVTRLETEYPEIHLSLEPLNIASPFELLKTGKLDCFMYWPERTPDEFAYLPLFEEKRKAYLNIQHPLSRQDSVTLEQLARVPQILFEYNEQDDSRYKSFFPEELREQLKLIKVKDVVSSRRFLELNKGVVIAPTGGILIESSRICEKEIVQSEDAGKIRLGLVYRPDNQNIILKKLISYL